MRAPPEMAGFFRCHRDVRALRNFDRQTPVSRRPPARPPAIVKQKIKPKGQDGTAISKRRNFPGAIRCGYSAQRKSAIGVLST